jgi:hypothetical protein
MLLAKESGNMLHHQCLTGVVFYLYLLKHDVRPLGNALPPQHTEKYP